MSLTRIGLAVVAIVAAVVAVFAVMRAIDERTAPPIIIDNTLVSPGIVVDLRGEVTNPGVYELPAGARLDDAIVAAGGLTEDADLTQINLASRLQDGAAVTVAGVAALAPGTANSNEGAVGAESGAQTTQLINLNTASAAELELLPGVGEVTAGRIIAYREANGPYRSADDLVHVQGISMKTINSLRDLVTTGP
ncbi:MAG: ComEA family DNA-binding protein [Thermomicrobiales bacterium]|nr:ComEA family DNA-binding protein [Thermomicrobiales bacterium]